LKSIDRSTRPARHCGLHPVGRLHLHYLLIGRHLTTLPKGKAANVGGSAVSGLEMAQNSQRTSWSAEQIDEKLRDIIKSCFDIGVDTAKEFVQEVGDDGRLPSLLAGSNIAGFSKVAAAMHAQGDWW